MVYELIQRERNLHAKQQINKKGQGGPLKPESVYIQRKKPNVQDFFLLL
jgi:hypothetical protein